MKTIDDIVREIVSAEMAKVKEQLLSDLRAYEDKTLDVLEAAEYLDISDKLIYRMCQQKQIPHERYGSIGSKRAVIKFRLHDLEVWRSEQRDSNYIRD